MRVYKLLIFCLLVLPGCFLKSKYALLHKNERYELPSFPGGYDSLEKFIENNRDKSLFLPDSLGYETDSFYEQHVLFSIDTLGKITDVNLLSWSGDTLLIPDIYRIISLMPKWEPAHIINIKTKKKRYSKELSSFSVKYFFQSKRKQ